jgi:hypothetical protein
MAATGSEVVVCYKKYSGATAYPDALVLTSETISRHEVENSML